MVEPGLKRTVLATGRAGTGARLGIKAGLEEAVSQGHGNGRDKNRREQVGHAHALYLQESQANAYDQDPAGGCHLQHYETIPSLCRPPVTFGDLMLQRLDISNSFDVADTYPLTASRTSPRSARTPWPLPPAPPPGMAYRTRRAP